MQQRRRVESRYFDKVFMRIKVLAF